MQNNDKTVFWLSRIGFGLIFIYCFFASLFYSYFAQLHLRFNFLPVPLFIGEILLFICLILFAWVCKLAKPFDRQITLLLTLYFGWVLIKALVNFYFDGPLTARNAALFYYPVFAVFAYCFYQKAQFPRKLLMGLLFLAGGIMFFKFMYVWCWWTYVTLFVIGLLNIKSVKYRRIGWVFLAVVVFLGKEYLYKGNRAHFVSVFGAVVFLVCYFGVLFYRRHDYVKLAVLLLSLFCFIMGFFIFSNKNDISSVTSIRKIINTYHDFDMRYQAEQVNFVPRKLSVHLYNPKGFTSYFTNSSCETSLPVSVDNMKQQIEKSNQLSVQVAKCPAIVSDTAPVDINKSVFPLWLENTMNHFFPKQNDVLSNILRIRIRDGRAMDLNENNIVFRLFVWRDMFAELIEQRAWWGFSFGHPQRSKSLEVLGWAESEWSRDGWITPHNSFFHIIYRSGILGVFLIGVLFFMIYTLIKDFLNLDSIKGGFLVGALVYWLVLSNFFVILEFPYNAIIFWTLFGITWGYRESLQKKIIN